MTPMISTPSRVGAPSAATTSTITTASNSRRHSDATTTSQSSGRRYSHNPYQATVVLPDAAAAVTPPASCGPIAMSSVSGPAAQTVSPPPFMTHAMVGPTSTLPQFIITAPSMTMTQERQHQCPKLPHGIPFAQSQSQCSTSSSSNPSCSRSMSSESKRSGSVGTTLDDIDVLHTATNCNVKVKDLPRECNTAELRDVFEKYFGSVVASVVMTDRRGRSRGYGYVLMRHEADAAFAIRQVTDVGLQIRGHFITAHLSKKKHRSLLLSQEKEEALLLQSTSETPIEQSQQQLQQPQQALLDAPLKSVMSGLDHLLESAVVENGVDGPDGLLNLQSNDENAIETVSYRLPLPPAIDHRNSWSDEVEQEDLASALVARVREASRMKLPLKERNVKKYFHRFLSAADTPKDVQEDFNSLPRHHQMSVYRELCKE